MYQPFAFNKTEVATIAPAPGPTPMVQLPSGAIVVYDFTNPSSWAGSGSVVYDLSGNYFTGTLTGSIGSGSSGGVSYDSALSMIQCGNGDTKFYNAFNQRKQMYVGVQYQTGSWSANTSLVSTWGTNSNNQQDFGYAFFMNGGSPASNQRTGIQVYTAGGTTGAAGYYLEPATPGWATGSLANTAGLMLNITSGSYKVYNNNTNIGTVTGITTSKTINYSTASGGGKGFRLGNRYGEPFRGQFKKFVAYNRALSDPELGTIEAWMTSSAPADYFPVNLNAGLLGRWEVTNTASWPGSGDTINNLATASAYSGLYGRIISASAIDVTNGVQFNGGNNTAGIAFGATGSLNQGSPGLNNPIVNGTEQMTIATVCYNDSTGPADAMMMNSWSDFNDNNLFLAIGRDGVSGVRTNSSYNIATGQGAYFVSNTVKFFASRVQIGANTTNWLGTSQFNSTGCSGNDFGATRTQANNSLHAWGNNIVAGATNVFNRSQVKGRWYASYIWNRILSDAELGQLQTYTNKFIAANS